MMHVKLGRVMLLTAAVFMLWLSFKVDAQSCIGCTWIDVSPTGQTLICTLLQSGQTYCEVQK
jgi:hypothetical protein